MKVGIFRNETEVAKMAAAYLIETMNGAPVANLGVATGSTPLPLYQQLREAHANGSFSLANAKAFALDEYIGLQPGHPESYRKVLQDELVGEDKTGLMDENLFTPNGNVDVPDGAREAAAAYDAAIKDNGGVHLQILGIGSNGHIGFNEPGISLSSRTHVDALARQTREDNARFFNGDLAKVPQMCITQGLGTILEATHIMLLATGEGKADAVAAAVEGPISSSCPASILQMHPSVRVYVDEAAAAKLKGREMHEIRWEMLA
ncbi:glucosamine-6-phosphate deaminase [Trueperella bonasi]|uniref:Glucosamine-6-phosphate deaminase n=1 Tax=Trueperella bonasi TaxID=312286 RepID=A0ABT9NH75_9ACTO|nr:glucosamine-6-phosphate deaminase [Trueperella bonasi]MDP9806725.1 glucosamine-6-phosphate deaminase [Trueperella bonasi]